ncbi:MAG: DNA-binding protein [Oscillospiraceae bacterium]|nr:DNA-binding protein [Oscillospiraceae bacterium]
MRQNRYIVVRIKWGISGRRVTYYCEAGRINGALKKGYMWLVPANAEKPLDGRYKENKIKGGEKSEQIIDC